MALPSVGVGLEASRRIERSAARAWWLTGQVGWQFVDDKALLADGNPRAGDWVEARLGLRAEATPHLRRRFTHGFGLAVFRAGEDPNLVKDAGTYYGAYAALGFETDLRAGWSAGPELSLMVGTRAEDLELNFVPRLSWHLRWHPGRRGAAPGYARPGPGELWAGAVAGLLPGLGGGLEAGQRIARTRALDLGLEALVVRERAREGAFFEEGGDLGLVRGGVSLRACPCARHGPVLRAGVAWFRSTARGEFFRGRGDHVGAYLGLGYEWDLAPGLRTGPEVGVLLATPEGEPRDLTLEAVPYALWRVVVRF